MTEADRTNRLVTAERDVIVLVITLAAIVLFVVSGGLAVPQAVSEFFFAGHKADNVLLSALLLNIALIIFGWRRYRELRAEIEQRTRAEEQARLLAELDPLTGCLNRRSMAPATEKVRAAAHARGQAVAYCLIDVDHFKQINDVYGHVAGDNALVELCRRFHKVLPEEARLARLGGDEFAIVMPYDRDRPERVDDLVIRLFEQASIPFDLDRVTIEATICVGVTSDDPTEPGEEISAETLMHRADMAMYEAKKQGRNRYFWFEPSMESELRFRNELEIGIRRGLQNGEFEPFYEQQIDLESGDLVGFEMLARWRSPQLGMVSPETFIPVAEEIGLINELSEQLMKQALVDAREWDDSLSLSVNISPVQLRDPWFAQKLLKQMVAAKFPPYRLEIEITESCLHENVGMVRSMITSLRNQGVKVSLDDFGTGYSSFEQLRTLPFDRLKIDRSFIAELRQSEGRSRIVDAIVSLGRGLNLPITAEGVEDETILAALKDMGGLKAQGYIYGKPETADQVRQRLRLAGLLTERGHPLRRSDSTSTAPHEDHQRRIFYP
ncbi:MAG: diguanylate cyclase [Erythrobacter sp. SCN 62-14]|nr:MAG: diguanylate cyclase [Erythrobacter sp. SCN 62-14]